MTTTYDDITSLAALREELAAITDAEADLYRHAKALAKSRRAATTRLAVAWDRELAEATGRTTCGFRTDYTETPDCARPLGHDDEHRGTGLVYSHAWDRYWLNAMADTERICGDHDRPRPCVECADD